MTAIKLPHISVEMVDEVDGDPRRGRLCSRQWYSYFENTVQVAIEGISWEQVTGWTAGTGTANFGAYATYAGQLVSAGYDQTEAQATDDAVKDVSQRVLALEQSMRQLGFIN